MLLEKCNQVRENIAEIGRRKKLKAAEDFYQTRHNQLRPLVPALGKVLDAHAWLVQAGFVQPPLPPIVRWLRAEWADVRTEFEADPSSVAQLGPARGRIIEQLELLIKNLSEAQTLAWQMELSRSCRAAQELIPSVRQVPVCRADADLLARLLQQLRQSSRSAVPATQTEVQLVLALRNEVDRLVESLRGRGMPAEVAEFVAAAEDDAGARLAALTPGVLEWLTEHEMADGFRVRRRT